MIKEIFSYEYNMLNLITILEESNLWVIEIFKGANKRSYK